MQARMGLTAPQELIQNTANTSPGEGQGAAQLWDPGWAQRRPHECKLSGCARVHVCHSFSKSAQHWQEQRELNDWGGGAEGATPSLQTWGPCTTDPGCHGCRGWDAVGRGRGEGIRPGAQNLSTDKIQRTVRKHLENKNTATAIKLQRRVGGQSPEDLTESRGKRRGGGKQDRIQATSAKSE